MGDLLLILLSLWLLWLAVRVIVWIFTTLIPWFGALFAALLYGARVELYALRVDLWIAGQKVRPSNQPPPELYRTKKPIKKLEEVASFSEAVARIQSNTFLSAQDALLELAIAHQAGLDRLESRGDLTPAVQAEFGALADTAAREMTGLSVDFSRSLPHLNDVPSWRRRRALKRWARQVTAGGR